MISLHVDVDNLWMYEREYGIKIHPNTELLYTQALPVLLDLFNLYQSKATFMVTGRDLKLGAAKRFCLTAVKAGHEIGNHTFSHPTDFSGLSRANKLSEVRKTHHLIKEITGKNPVGFRSPGYRLDDEILPELHRLGYSYDSSRLPGYAQWLMSLYAKNKAGEIKQKRFGQLKDIFSPSRPYLLTEKPKLTELPISVLPWIRMPLHTTFIYYFGEAYRKLVLKYLNMRPQYVMYLVHAIDGVSLEKTSLNCPVIPLRYSFSQRMTLVEKIVKGLIRANGGPLQTTANQLKANRHGW